ncbi:MAG: hypothetical protein DWI59_00280 [Chloroflexi bacterium]|nr:MAG: hypothetical protein DWI59_00280 [Chloroflexota bacterium]
MQCDSRRRAAAMPFDQPLLVVALREGDKREAEFLDRGEGLDPPQLPLQGADEALGTAVALGSGDKRRCGTDAQEAQLVLKMVAHVLAAVVVAQREPRSDVSPVAPEVLTAP